MLPQAAGRLARGARTLSTASGAQLACLDDVRRSVRDEQGFGRGLPRATAAASAFGPRGSGTHADQQHRKPPRHFRLLAAAPPPPLPPAAATTRVFGLLVHPASQCTAAGGQGPAGLPAESRVQRCHQAGGARLTAAVCLRADAAGGLRPRNCSVLLRLQNKRIAAAGPARALLKRRQTVWTSHVPEARSCRHHTTPQCPAAAPLKPACCCAIATSAAHCSNGKLKLAPQGRYLHDMFLHRVEAGSPDTQVGGGQVG